LYGHIDDADDENDNDGNNDDDNDDDDDDESSAAGGGNGDGHREPREREQMPHTQRARMTLREFWCRSLLGEFFVLFILFSFVFVLRPICFALHRYVANAYAKRNLTNAMLFWYRFCLLQLQRRATLLMKKPQPPPPTSLSTAKVFRRYHRCRQHHRRRKRHRFSMLVSTFAI
jgi:hypothetical protein